MITMTRFERTRLISARALQLSLGAPPLVKVGKGMRPYDLAKQELEEAVLPLVALRTFPNGKTERIAI